MRSVRKHGPAALGNKTGGDGLPVTAGCVGESHARAGHGQLDQCAEAHNTAASHVTVTFGGSCGPRLCAARAVRTHGPPGRYVTEKTGILGEKDKAALHLVTGQPPPQRPSVCPAGGAPPGGGLILTPHSAQRPRSASHTHTF